MKFIEKLKKYRKEAILLLIAGVFLAGAFLVATYTQNNERYTALSLNTTKIFDQNTSLRETRFNTDSAIRDSVDSRIQQESTFQEEEMRRINDEEAREETTNHVTEKDVTSIRIQRDNDEKEADVDKVGDEEQVQEIEGRLLMSHADPEEVFEQREGDTHSNTLIPAPDDIFHLDTGEKLYEIELDKIQKAQHKDALQSGAIISVSGNIRDFLISDISGIRVLQYPEVNTDMLYARRKLPTKKIAVFHVNFQDDQSEPISVNKTKELLETGSPNVRQYIFNQSYGMQDIDISYYDWLTITDDVTGTCNFSDWANLADDAMLSQNGVDVEGYTNIMYVMQLEESTCNWGGLGHLGAGGVGGSQPLRSWIKLTSTSDLIWSQTVMMHELGHNLGLDHAGQIVCTDSSGRQTVTIDGHSCWHSEYGDFFNVMGLGILEEGELSAFDREFLGYFSTSNMFTVDSVYNNVRLYPINTPGNNIKAIKIPKARNSQGDIVEYYTIEYRSRTYSRFTSEGPGVQIRITNAISTDRRKTATLRFRESYYRIPFLHHLKNKDSFVDVRSGITVNVLHMESDYVQLEIIDQNAGNPQCIQRAPLMNLSPSTVTNPPATRSHFTLRFKNNNSPECHGAGIKIEPLTTGSPEYSQSTYQDEWTMVQSGKTITRNYWIESPQASWFSYLPLSAYVMSKIQSQNNFDMRYMYETSILMTDNAHSATFQGNNPQ